MLDTRIQTLADWIKAEDGFTLVAHTSPDGDTLGSCLALFRALRDMGKRVQMVCDCRVPPIYEFLPYAGEVLGPDGLKEGFPNVVAVDCADKKRMGRVQALIPDAKALAVVDHHKTNSGFGTYNLVCPEAAATGELIYRLMLALKIPLSREVATCLYVAVNTDTGNFAYSNTTPETLRIAAALLETGIDVAEINRLIYRTTPYAKIKLLGRALTGIVLYAGARIGMSKISQKDMAECGATSEDVEGIIDNIRDVDTVEIAILVREAMDGTFKVSFRSKQYADVCILAEAFGGGGHQQAAGCTMQAPLSEVEKTLISAATAILEPQ